MRRAQSTMLRAAWFGAALQCHSAPLVHATKSLRRSDADVHSGSNTLQLANRAVELALRSLAWLLLASAASAGRGRAAPRGAPPPALAVVALAACLVPLGRLAQAQECTTTNQYDDTPDVAGSCAEFIAGGTLACDPDFIAGSGFAG